jgi:hypothetical protein
VEESRQTGSQGLNGGDWETGDFQACQEVGGKVATGFGKLR